jgi:hypothetical protein
MFFKRSSLINLLTFPGIIVHELSHQLFCRLFHIPVFKVVYFQTRNPAGYVLHEILDNKNQSIIITIGPFIINTLLGFIISLPAALPTFQISTAKPVDYVLVYLGFTLAMHAFPSNVDIKSSFSKTKEKNTAFLIKIIGYPITGLIFCNTLKGFFWLELVYGLILSIGLPHLLVWILA